MRSVVVKGIDDDLIIELGREVEIVFAVIKIGKAIDAITYELVVDGTDLINFMKENNLIDKINNDIKENNRYVITAYDW